MPTSLNEIKLQSVEDVKKGRFPTDEHCYHILPETADEYQKMLDELRR